MKIAKIMNVILIALVMQNIWAMESEPAKDEFSVDRQFLEGKISPDNYLSYIASLSGDYAYKVRAVRNVQEIAPQASYEEFLNRLALIPIQAQQALAGGNRIYYEKMVAAVRDYVKMAIDAYIRDLEQGVQMRHGRIS